VNLKRLTLAACAFTLLSSGHFATPQAAAPAATGAAPGPLPLTFEVNRGQVGEPVKFLARRPGHTVLLTPREALLVLDRPNRDPRMLRMQFEGARPDPAIEGRTPLAGKVNYLVGSDPREWHTEVPLFAQVAYRTLYPSIDLVLRGGHDDLVEYDFVVAPGGNPSDIVLRFDGAERLEIDRAGDLRIVTADGVLVQRKPVAYQKRGKSRDEVPSRFVMRGRDRVAFEVGDYDRGATLVIDSRIRRSSAATGSTASTPSRRTRRARPTSPARPTRWPVRCRSTSRRRTRFPAERSSGAIPCPRLIRGRFRAFASTTRSSGSSTRRSRGRTRSST
jgi:hypothetical protein